MTKQPFENFITKLSENEMGLRTKGFVDGSIGVRSTIYSKSDISTVDIVPDGEEVIMEHERDNGFYVTELVIRFSKTEGVRLRREIIRSDNYDTARVFGDLTDENYLNSYINAPLGLYEGVNGWELNKYNERCEIVLKQPIFVTRGMKITVQNRSDEDIKVSMYALINEM